MLSRERMRVYMAHLRATWRAQGCCPRCGGPLRDGEQNCRPCRLKRAVNPVAGWAVTVHITNVSGPPKVSGWLGPHTADQPVSS